MMQARPVLRCSTRFGQGRHARADPAGPGAGAGSGPRRHRLTDVLFILASLMRVVPASATICPRAWRRHPVERRNRLSTPVRPAPAQGKITLGSAER